MEKVISDTMNIPHNEKIVVVRETKLLKFHIPFGVDLEDKNVVESWDASGGELVIKYAKQYAKYHEGKQVIDFYEEHDDDDPFVDIEEVETKYDYKEYEKYVDFDLLHFCDECKKPIQQFVENCYGINCYPCYEKKYAHLDPC